ncbi:MAG: oxygen-independent coproporphyrinogen III oxidase [Bacteroidales bacterium]|nr:oxygen-independent coproporphyrinogen III oxidase [Bacteroidales bacterium]MBN2821523.1 oxygen-independent coproporphyrinogen III oxidase [Bacteroidales bacterium]
MNKELIEKYNNPVPRYTSYPPANHFSDSFTADNYKELIQTSNTSQPEHIAFYVHIPFCKQICYYCGCNALPINNKNEIDKYIQALKKEIKLVISMLDKNRKVSQIHYGGGTPNAIEARYLKEINELFSINFSFIDRPEIAIEIHPGIINKAYIDELFNAGFNRFSIGIQDFDENVLKSVNRKPSAIPIEELMHYMRSNPQTAGLNLDFIYGLTGQTVENFTNAIQKAIEVRPDRLVTFSYAHVPWLKKHQQILKKKGLPSSDEKLNMFLAAYNLLQKEGYQPIGFDHFALPDDELSLALNNHYLHRNFQGYCTRRTTGQVYAFGVSGISQIDNGFAQNTKDIFKYNHLLNNGILPTEKGITINYEQKIIRELIIQLMCNQYINWAQIAKSFNTSAEKIKQLVNFNQDQLDTLVSDGLISYTNDDLRVSEIGNFFIRNIAVLFDPAYKLVENKYSKTV